MLNETQLYAVQAVTAQPEYQSQPYDQIIFARRERYAATDIVLTGEGDSLTMQPYRSAPPMQVWGKVIKIIHTL